MAPREGERTRRLALRWPPAMFPALTERLPRTTTTFSRFSGHRTSTRPGHDAEKTENKNMGNRLYVGNLSFSATNDTVRAAFSSFGEITDVHVVSDRDSGQSRGFGFVTMGSADAAQKAIAEMNGAMLDGRALKVNEAEERQGGGGRGGGGGGGG